MKRREGPPVEPAVVGSVWLYHGLDGYELPDRLEDVDPGAYICSGLKVPLQEFDSLCDVVKMFIKQEFAGRPVLRHGDMIAVEPTGCVRTIFLLLHPEGQGSLLRMCSGLEGVSVLPTHGGLYYVRMDEKFSLED